MPEGTQIVNVRLPNGSIAQIEATVISGTETEEERRIAFEIHSFDGVLDIVEGMAGAVWSTLAKIAPHKASVEFGFEVGVQNGQLTGLFVKGSGKGNLKITLEWAGKNSETKG